MVKAGHECRSKDKNLGNYKTWRQCAAAVMKKKGRFFIFGNKRKAGKCYMESTKSAACKEGFERDEYDFYALGSKPAPVKKPKSRYN